ncbi:MAG: TIGR03560 family F420-dependent LLM class oxidoreductase [Candidatus Limnocylindria bacterium]
MEFGIQIEPQFGFSFDEVREVARDAETLGLHAVWVSDHLFLNKEAEKTNCLEAWTLLAALAQTTTRIRLGTLVTCQSYRNPALLAKIAAGVDHMSGGRLEFGIGAGWKELEYRAYGYDFPPPAVRLRQLTESIEICRRMWTEDRPSYRGRHYAIDGAFCAPKPAQRPHPRIWVAGAKPRMLRIVARYADAVNIGDFPSAQAYAAAMTELERACAEIGRDPTRIMRSHFGGVVLGATQADLDRIVGTLAGAAGMSADRWLAARQRSIIGTPEMVIGRMREYAALGVRYWAMVFPYGHEREMLSVFADKVMPALS